MTDPEPTSDPHTPKRQRLDLNPDLMSPALQALDRVATYLVDRGVTDPETAVSVAFAAVYAIEAGGFAITPQQRRDP